MNLCKKWLLSLVAAIVLAVSLPGFIPGADNAAVAEAAAKVRLNKTKATLLKGQSLQLKMRGTRSKVTWRTSRKSVATVSRKGKVTAKKKGSATITAIVRGKRYRAKITVEVPRLNKRSLTLNKGKTYRLKVNGTKQKVKWSTANKNVATVSQKGVVTAKKSGTAVITARVLKKKFTCRITVKAAAQKPVKPGPSEAQKLKENIRKLKSYIAANGEETHDDRKVLTFNSPREGTARLYYDPAKDELEFEFGSDVELMWYSVRGIFNPETQNTMLLTYKEYDISDFSVLVGQTEMRIDIKTYRRGVRPAVKVVMNKNRLVENSQDWLLMAFPNWENLLKETKLGLTMSDIGFTSFK